MCIRDRPLADAVGHRGIDDGFDNPGGGIDFAVAGDALIGVDFDDDAVLGAVVDLLDFARLADRDGFHFCYFHVITSNGFRSRPAFILHHFFKKSIVDC